ncbi:MAG TPA: tetratricopeptide repeat protein, partial [Bacillota bacterium]|nr:tetratricopeptide repeat protein [Bacillota bacterium]
AIRAYRLTQKEKWSEAAKAYEKALKRKYYKGQWELYLESAKAYTKAKNFSDALKVLKAIPAEYKDMMDYQVTLATVHKENNQPKKAAQTLLDFGAKHAQELNIHQQLQQVLTEWKMTDAAKKEADIVAQLQQKEAAELQKAQQNLEQKNQQTGAANTTDTTNSTNTDANKDSNQSEKK